MHSLELASFIFYLLIFVLIILTNLFVVVIFLCVKTLRTPSNMLLMSLAIIDLITGGTAVLLRIFETKHVAWTLSISHCRLSHFISVLNIIATILSLVALAIDRYIAIQYPFKHVVFNTNSFRYVGGIVLTVWLTSLFVSSAPYWVWGSTEQKGRRLVFGVCKFNETLTKNYVLFFTLIVAVSIVTILIVDIKLYRIAKLHRLRIHPIVLKITEITSSNHTAVDELQTQTTASNDNGRFNLRRHTSTLLTRRKLFLKTWRTTQTMFIVFSIFAICWIGFFIATIIFLKCPGCVNKYVVTIASLLLFSNNAINPFVYIIRTKSFRRRAKLAFVKMVIFPSKSLTD